MSRVISNYGTIPRDVATDGGYAGKENVLYSQEIGIKNIVFNKIVGRLGNVTSSKKMAKVLKKWRSGMESVISNFKRDYDMFVYTWKGWKHFQAKVLWSAIAYNIRVMTGIVLGKLLKTTTT